VIPYNALGDPDADKFLPWCWQRLQQDDLVDLYFPGQRDTGFATFVRLFSGDANVAIFKAEGEGTTWDDRIPGFITWTPMPMGASSCISAGFIFFRKFWGHGATDAAARAAFDLWFDKLKVDVVLGSCPSLHKLAIRYNERIGLRETGRIPKAHLFKGIVCDAILYAMTREEWEAKCHSQP
jgi:RimJ/RimL family protein N-acetyltransferase